MKKTVFEFGLILAITASTGLAYTSNAAFTWNPTGPTSVSAGSNFSETLQLQITGATPTQITGFDLILEGATVQGGKNISGDFAVTGTSSPLTSAGWIPAGIPTFPETLTSGNSDHPGFSQNADNLGYAGPPAQPASNYSSPTSIETLTLSIAPNTPAGTYTFETTGVYQTPAGGTTARFSDITNSGDPNSPYQIAPATFTITVVPEPATWSLFVLGAIATFGLTVWRSRCTS
jgi:hypothetical protein